MKKLFTAILLSSLSLSISMTTFAEGFVCGGSNGSNSWYVVLEDKTATTYVEFPNLSVDRTIEERAVNYNLDSQIIPLDEVLSLEITKAKDKQKCGENADGTLSDFHGTLKIGNENFSGCCNKN